MNFDIVIDGDAASIVMQENAERNDFSILIGKLGEIKGLKEIRFDLKNLYYVKSETLSEFIGVKKWAGRDVKTVLLNANENVYQILEMANLLSIFEVRSDYGSYSPDELVMLFQNMDNADRVSEYMAGKYSDEFRSALLANLQAGDAVTQEYCVLTIGRAHDYASMETIRKCLDSEYSGVLRAAILVLGWMGDMESKERFYAFLSSDFDEVSEAAGASISLLSDESDPARLGKLAQSGNPTLRKVIAGTLSMINGDEAFTIIVDMLKSEQDDDVRKVLARRISFFNRPEATEILVSLLDDKSQAVQEAAASGLERTGLGEHEQEVLKKVSSKDSWIGYFAVKALGRKFSLESAKAMIDNYDKCGNNLKLAIVEAIGYADLPETASFLEQRLGDENDDIRKEALGSLSRFDAPKAALVAKELAVKDESWLVRYRAVEILNNQKPEGYIDILKKVGVGDDNKYIQEKVRAMLGS